MPSFWARLGSFKHQAPRFQPHTCLQKNPDKKVSPHCNTKAPCILAPYPEAPWSPSYWTLEPVDLLGFQPISLAVQFCRNCPKRSIGPITTLLHCTVPQWLCCPASPRLCLWLPVCTPTDSSSWLSVCGCPLAVWLTAAPELLQWFAAAVACAATALSSISWAFTAAAFSCVQAAAGCGFWIQWGLRDAVKIWQERLVLAVSLLASNASPPRVTDPRTALHLPRIVFLGLICRSPGLSESFLGLTLNKIELTSLAKRLL